MRHADAVHGEYHRGDGKPERDDAGAGDIWISGPGGTFGRHKRERGALNVRFTKLFHSHQGVHRDPIAGTVDNALTSIEGDLRLLSGFSGRFVLVRALRGVKAKRTRQSEAVGINQQGIRREGIRGPSICRHLPLSPRG
jgi:hypothetical protein